MSVDITREAVERLAERMADYADGDDYVEFILRGARTCLALRDALDEAIERVQLLELRLEGKP